MELTDDHEIRVALNWKLAELVNNPPSAGQRTLTRRQRRKQAQRLMANQIGYGSWSLIGIMLLRWAVWKLIAYYADRLIEHWKESR